MERISKNRLTEIIRKMVNEEVDKLNARAGGISMDDVEHGITLYHRPKDGRIEVAGQSMSVINSLFKYGFSREYTNSNGGNMYGAGIYTVYNLRSSNEKATGYGSAIIKVKLLGGYKDFLIFSKQIARQVYGERWTIESQLKYLFGKYADDIIRNCSPFIMHDDNSHHGIAPSSQSCYKVACYLRSHPEIEKGSKIRGYIYNGGHDGACCFIKDFQSALPVAVSFDNGKTWENKLSQELVDRFNTEIDTEFQYGQNYDEVSEKSINGYVIVWNRDKANYIEAGGSHPISDVWFDKAFAWEKKNGVLFANVVYNGYELFLTKENGEYMVYSTDWEPQCTLQELPTLV